MDLFYKGYDTDYTAEKCSVPAKCVNRIVRKHLNPRLKRFVVETINKPFEAVNYVTIVTLVRYYEPIKLSKLGLKPSVAASLTGVSASNLCQLLGRYSIQRKTHKSPTDPMVPFLNDLSKRYDLNGLASREIYTLLCEESEGNLGEFTKKKRGVVNCFRRRKGLKCRPIHVANNKFKLHEFFKCNLSSVKTKDTKSLYEKCKKDCGYHDLGYEQFARRLSYFKYKLKRDNRNKALNQLTLNNIKREDIKI
jgi:hypothetical protein